MIPDKDLTPEELAELKRLSSKVWLNKWHTKLRALPRLIAMVERLQVENEVLKHWKAANTKWTDRL